MNRSMEETRERLRREYMANLWDNARLMDSKPLLHVVDADALTKCRLSMYGQIRDANRFIYRTGDEEDVQKARSRVGAFNDRLEFPTEENLEKLYFDYYGTGYNGSPAPDRPGAPYTCPCGLRMMTPGIAMPDACPSCGRLTPMGEMVRDGVLRRRCRTTRGTRGATRSWSPRPRACPGWPGSTARSTRRATCATSRARYSARRSGAGPWRASGRACRWRRPAT